MSLVNLKDFTDEQLRLLVSQINAELNDRDPAVIQRRKEEKEFWDAFAKRREEKIRLGESMSRVLAKILKPGMRLKMKGCKDGNGLREFIKWDDDGNLVCWQISHRVWPEVIDKGKVVRREETKKTNQVTTHMPDKVSKIWIGGKEISASSLL